MAWDKEIEQLHHRRELAEEQGGEVNVGRQHKAGRLTVRERIDHLVDESSFQEIGKTTGVGEYSETGELTGVTPAPYVSGLAKIDGRPVVVGGEDFTVRGGSADATIKGKHNMCEEMANALRLPLIRMVEGSGGGGSVKASTMAS